MRIGIPKERREHEQRVAASPDTVKRYKGLGLDPVVERGAGQGAAIPDQAFADAGATLVDGPDEVWASDIVLKVRPPTEEETGRLRQGQILIGMLEPYTSREQLGEYASKGARAFAMELLPRTTRGQAMDVLSSQANLAGYPGAVESMHVYPHVLPLIITTAGTMPASNVFFDGPAETAYQALFTTKHT